MKDETELYHAVSHQLTDGRLEIKMPDTDLVNDDLKTTDELRKAFLKHKDSKYLFKGHWPFRNKKQSNDTNSAHTEYRATLLTLEKEKIK